MFKFLKRFWSVGDTILEGVETNARTFVHLSTIGEQNALAYSEKATHERNSSLTAYRLQAAKQEAKLALASK